MCCGREVVRQRCGTAREEARRRGGEGGRESRAVSHIRND